MSVLSGVAVLAGFVWWDIYDIGAVDVMRSRDGAPVLPVRFADAPTFPRPYDA